MRPVLHGDVSAAARALLHAPAGTRRSLCRRMLSEAEMADAHVRATGRLHPLFGNGSLMSAARKRVLADEPGFDDPGYCRCFEIVLSALIHRQISRARN
ncbi:hypothetical protein KBY24_04375 [Ruegeria pomeroyi]|nr:hypothetical protein [Ruegeria pomeroyi]MCE8520220.1 hypothetical protein [Ruegeria pomeroyi]MCE8523658.1 hypothetical protein [Ruegeria pomeroyi]MCE8531207.1 hypothetical protein [Ruegeria pomeroyi]MCE8532608.1 hypothetical protein [Ruegeria pomeroyi]